MRSTIWMDFLIKVDDKLWFVLGDYNWLAYISLIDGQIKIVSEVKSESETFRLFASGVLYGTKLVFAPFHSKNIMIFDTLYNKYDYISVPADIAGTVQFSNTVVYDNKIIMIGSYKNHKLMELNMDNLNIKVYDFSDCMSYDSTLSRDVVCVDNKVLLSVKEEGKIITFDLIKGEFYVDQITKTSGFGTIISYNDSLLLSSRDAILEIDKQGKINKYMNFPKEYGMYYVENDQLLFQNGYHSSLWGQPFLRSHIWKDKILFVSAVMSTSIIYDITNKKSRSCSLMEYNENGINDSNKGITSLYNLCSVQDENLVYVFSSKNKIIFCVDLENNIIKEIAYYFSNEDEKYFVNNILKCIMENESFTLNKMILAIKD